MDYLLSHKGLILEKYGSKAGKVVLKMIERLGKKRGGPICYLDEMACGPGNAKEKGSVDAETFTAWVNSLSMDTTRSHTFLIVGGHGVVPFHEVPNPTHDQDGAILSDAPYASRNGEFLIPQRSIGRIPDSDGDNGDMLMTVLESMLRYHDAKSGFEESFGYSASIWRSASKEVYRIIGEGDEVRLSPPLSADKLEQEWLKKQLLYFNLHGSRETANWYGQRSPTDPPEFDQFPVAITPENIPSLDGSCVFSEACYGAWIKEKAVDESLALTFLAKGALAFIGSTAIAYGPVEPPSGEADLLGKYFYGYALRNMPFGDALRHAKIDFARTMIRKQGFLDSDDRKTLIEFHLYGDPALSLIACP